MSFPLLFSSLFIMFFSLFACCQPKWLPFLFLIAFLLVWLLLPLSMLWSSPVERFWSNQSNGKGKREEMLWYSWSVKAWIPKHFTYDLKFILDLSKLVTELEIKIIAIIWFKLDSWSVKARVSVWNGNGYYPPWTQMNHLIWQSSWLIWETSQLSK